MSTPEDDDDDVAASGLTPDQHARLVARIRDLPEIEPTPGWVDRVVDRARDAGVRAGPIVTPDQTALGIYVVAARDWCDALEMIAECTDAAALRALLGMLEAKGGPRTDHELNALLIGPAQSRIDELSAPIPV